MIINGRKIGLDAPPYVIAEMSANHNGRLENAFRLVDEAKKAGVDALKIQTYTPDSMTLDSDEEDFQIHGGLWDGWSLYGLYEWAQTPWDWHKPLFDYARQLGMTIFSTPFDSSAVDFLEDLNVPAYKIASFEVVDLSLIRYAASTGKPMIISTGMADAEEIQEAIEAARTGGCSDLAILHCVSGYPAPANDYNLRTIVNMIERFGLVTGLSDHSLSNATAIASVALGASIIEKHFTLDRSGGGPDDSFSLMPAELSELCNSVKTAWSSLGRVNYERKLSEISNIKFRRSLYVVEDIAEGELFTEKNIRSIRPGFGMAPKFFSDVLGRKAKCFIKRASRLTPELIDQVSENDK
jgi:pseudaminic acid synthase